MANFYDKVAKKLGGYAYAVNKPQYFTIYENGDPEQIFKEKLLELADLAKTAFDLGCGDGKFTFEIASHFARIIGLDTSKELLKVARQKQKELNVGNVEFILGNAENIAFADGFFNILYCRRGPNFYSEYFRLLKHGGYFLEVGIGEKDAVELKKVFGRGQNYGKWNTSRLKSDINEYKRLGANIIFAEEFSSMDYYKSHADFDRFLQGVPIFEDYNSKKDKKYVDSYIKQFQTKNGIALKRHRVVYVIQKNLQG